MTRDREWWMSQMFVGGPLAPPICNPPESIYCNRVECPTCEGTVGKKPGYTQEENRYRIEVDRVSKALYKAVSAKCKREGISMRALILGWLKEWVNK